MHETVSSYVIIIINNAFIINFYEKNGSNFLFLDAMFNMLVSCCHFNQNLLLYSTVVVLSGNRCCFN